MKKYLIVITIFMNCLLFTNIYNCFKEQDIADCYHLFGFKENKSEIHFQLASAANEMNPNEFYGVLQECVDQYGVDIVYTKQDYFENTNDIYLLTNADIKKEMGLITSDQLTFRIDSKESYDTGKNLYFLNKDMQVSIYPLPIRSKTYPLSTDYTILSSDRKTQSAAVDFLMLSLGEAITGVYETHQHDYDLQSELTKNLQTLIPLTACALFLILLYLLSQQLSEISILKLNGYSSFDVVKELFLKSILGLFGLTILVHAGLYLIFVRAVNPRSYTFSLELGKTIAIEFLALIVIIIALFLVIRLLSLPLLIKNYNFPRLFLNATVLVKILILLVTLPMLCSLLEESRYTIESRVALYQMEDSLKDIYYISGYKEGYLNDGFNLAEFIMDKENAAYLKYAGIYEALDEQGGIYCSNSRIMTSASQSYTVMIINKNYLLSHPLVNENGEFIAPLIDDKAMTYLIPKSYEEDREGIVKTSLPEGNEVNSFIIPDSQDLLNYYFLINYKKIDNPIFLVYGNEAEWYQKNVFSTMFFPTSFDIERIEQVLERFGDKGKAEYQFSNEAMSSNKRRYNRELSDLVIQFVFALFLVLFQISEFVVLYQASQREKIWNKRILGYSTFSIYKYLYAESILYYLIPFFLLKEVQGIQLILFIFVFFEVLVFLVFTKSGGEYYGKTQYQSVK